MKILMILQNLIKIHSNENLTSSISEYSNDENELYNIIKNIKI